LDKLFLHHFGCSKTKKIRVPKQSRKGQLNRAKLPPQAVQQPSRDKDRLISPPKIKGRVNPFTKANMVLRFPTLTTQCNQRESGALFHAEQLNGQNN
jgi:hypothetical protein